MSKNVRVYDLNDIDLSRIVYSKPTKCNKNKSSILISYNDPELGRVPLLVRLPSLYLVDGIKKVNSRSITHEIPLLLHGKKKDITTNTVSPILLFKLK